VYSVVSMVSRDRVLTALRCQEPDRVPFVEAAIDEQIALALLGRQSPPSQSGAPFSLPGGIRMGYRPSANLPVYRAIDIVQELGLDAMGMTLYLPDCAVHQLTDDNRQMVVGGTIKSRADVAQIQLPDPDDPRIYAPLREFLAEYRSTGLALFCRMPLCAEPVILGMGFEGFAYAVYDTRSLLEDLFEMYSSWYARAMQHVCALDFDFIWSGEDIAFKTGTYVSPAVFRELFMPSYRRVAAAITKPWIVHSDGNLMPIIDDLLELGLNGLHPIEPGAMDISHLKRRYGKRLCLCGHIDLETLSNGTPEDVARLVKATIAIAGPGGGYIAGSSNSIASYCKTDNVRAMKRAIFDYGRYPLSAHRPSMAS